METVDGSSTNKLVDILYEWLQSYDKDGPVYVLKICKTTSESPVLVVDAADLRKCDIGNDIIGALGHDTASYRKVINAFELAVKKLARQFNVSINIRVRFRGIEETRVSLMAVGAEYYQKGVTVRGRVVSMSPKVPYVTRFTYRCTDPDCKTKGFPRTVIARKDGEIINEPNMCSECKSKFIEIMESEIHDSQIVKIIEAKPTPNPSSLQIWCVGKDICNKVEPGKVVDIFGMVDIDFTKISARPVYRINANNIEHFEGEYEDFELTDIDIQRFSKNNPMSIVNQPGFWDKAWRSFAPEVLGMKEVKEALLMLSVSLNLLKKNKGSTVEGLKGSTTINMLIAGCLTGDTRVALGDGTLVRIDSLASHHQEMLNVKVLTGEGNRGVDIATQFHRYESMPIIEAVTESGRIIKGTPNHPLRIMENREYRWKRLDELILGDRLCVVGRIPCYRKRLAETGFKVVDAISGPKYVGKVPAFVDMELAGFMGYIIGDGWLDKNHKCLGFIVAADEIDLLPNLTRIVKNQFGPHTNITIEEIEPKPCMIVDADGSHRVINRTMTLTRVGLRSSYIARMLSFLRDKRVPDLIFKSPDTVAAAFLRWLFEADGTVRIRKSRGDGINSIELKSSRIELLRDCQLLLLRFAIHGRITKSAHNSWVLRISRKGDMLEYMRLIGFCSNKKQTYCKHLAQAIEKINDVYLRTLPRTEKVTSIRRCMPETVYDITVPKSHRFVANGIVSHNSPGIAKSRCLKYISRVAPNSGFVSAATAREASLTVFAENDKDSGYFMITPGFLPRCNDGIACMDEFDKADKVVYTKLHEIGSDKTCSYSKGGHSGQLPADCAIVCACNSIFPYWNERVDIQKNLAFMPPSMLTRFDLIFIILDKIDRAGDHAVALKVFENNDELWWENYMDDKDDVFGFRTMRKYITFINTRIPFPKLPKELEKYIAIRYTKKREDESLLGLITPRYVNNITRLAVAHARFLQKPVIDIDDLDIAESLLEWSMKAAAFDPVSGKFDANITNGMIPKSEIEQANSDTDLFKKTLDHLRRAQGGDFVPQTDARAELMRNGIEDNRIKMMKTNFLRIYVEHPFKAPYYQVTEHDVLGWRWNRDAKL